MLGSKGKVCSPGIRAPFTLCRVQRSLKRISIEVGFPFFPQLPASWNSIIYVDTCSVETSEGPVPPRGGAIVTPAADQKTDAHNTGPVDRPVTDSDSS